MKLLSGFAGVRALAAITVVLYHLNQKLPLEHLSLYALDMHDFVARLSVVVSVFFFLSGFFRSLSYWKSLDIPEKIPTFFPSLRDRFMRIAPPYYIALLISMVVSYSIRGADSVDILAGLSGVLFLGWIHPDTLFPALLDGPLWFVSFDMMGWIFTSLVMMGYVCLRRYSQSVFLMMGYFVMIFLGFLGLHLLWVSLPWPTTEIFPANYWFPYYNPFLFFLHFFFGIVTAGLYARYIGDRWKSHIRYDIWCLFCVIVLFFFLFWIRHDGDDFAYSWLRGPYYFPWVQILLSCIFFTLPLSRYIGRWLDNQLFIFFSKISYSLYLIHVIVLELFVYFIFREISSMTEWCILAVCTFSLSTFLAWISYRYIESH